MAAGPYGKRIVIYTQPYYTDTDGGVVKSPIETHATVWGRVDSPTAREAESFQQRQTEITHKVELRSYLSTVTAKMGVTFESRTFEIEGVTHDEMKHKWTLLYCREIV
jgi:SPP1 family predicted phage head-tail adaptor